MHPLVPWIWAVGAIHLAIVAGSALLPGKLQLHENLAKLPPFLRQVFLVHWLYILIVLVFFSSAGSSSPALSV